MVKFPVVLVFFLPNFLWTFIRGDVSCDFKQNCILPCRFQPNPELVLHWIQTPGNIQVHSFYHNQDQLGYQNKRFSGRTSLFKDQISSGNASLQLTGVKFEDEATYKCYTSTISGNNELFVKINVDAPVQKVNIKLAEKTISCSSEGIYPKPELTWSTDPPSSLNYNSAVQPNGQLFDITSSLTLSGSDIDLKYSCTVSTRKNTKRATLFKQNEINKLDSEVTIPCTNSKTPVNSFIWTFNHSQVIVTKKKTGISITVSEDWSGHVKSISETGTLTLQSLSSDQKGVYMCEATNANETLITKNTLQITEEQQKSSVSIAVGVVVLLIAVAGITGLVLWRLRSKEKDGKKGKAKEDDNLEHIVPLKD